MGRYLKDGRAVERDAEQGARRLRVPGRRSKGSAFRAALGIKASA